MPFQQQTPTQTSKEIPAMSAPRIITATAAVAALAATGVAGAAEAPVVSQQEFIAGAAPLTIPGTGVEQGEWMGSKARLVYRDVTLEGRQQVRLTLRAPKGLKVRGLAVEDGSKIAFTATRRSYAGKRQVTVRARVAGRHVAAGETTARVYALAR
jgi:hypothetical protein